MLAIIETSNRVSQELLKKFGIFAKVMLKPQSPRSPEFVYKVLEHKRVSVLHRRATVFSSYPRIFSQNGFFLEYSIE